MGVMMDRNLGFMEKSPDSNPLSGSRAQDRFIKVQLNKDLMIREPYWTTDEPTQNEANSGKLVYKYLEHQLFISEKQVLRSLLAQLAERCTEVKTDLGSNLVCATPKHLFFYYLFVDTPFLGKSLLNHYWTLLN